MPFVEDDPEATGASPPPPKTPVIASTTVEMVIEKVEINDIILIP